MCHHCPTLYFLCAYQFCLNYGSVCFRWCPAVGIAVICVSPENWLTACLPLPFTTHGTHAPFLRSSDRGWERIGCWEDCPAHTKHLLPGTRFFTPVLASGQQMTPMPCDRSPQNIGGGEQHQSRKRVTQISKDSRQPYTVSAKLLIPTLLQEKS